MVVAWCWPGIRAVWLSILSVMVVAVESSSIATTATTTAIIMPAKCDPSVGLQTFYFPVVDRGDSCPEMFVYAIMTDLVFRSHFDSDASRIFGGLHPKLMNIPNLHPCLRIEIKLVPTHSSPRQATAGQNVYIYPNYSENITSSTKHTHNIFYGFEDLVHFRAGQAADAANIVHLSGNTLAEAGNKKFYPNFFRIVADIEYQFQPIWGFYRLYGWRAFIIISTMDPRQSAFYDLFLVTCNLEGIDPLFISSALLTYLEPFPTYSLTRSLQVVRELPVRVAFMFVEPGFQFLPKSYVDMVIDIQVDIGLWLPTYQIISSKEVTQSVYMTTPGTRALIGNTSIGSFFFSDTHLLHGNNLARFMSPIAWWIGKVLAINGVDFNLPGVQARYGMTYWKPEALKSMLQQDSTKGLVNMFYSLNLQMMQIEVWKGDMLWRHVVAHNCFITHNGKSGVRDAALLRECAKNTTRDDRMKDSLIFDLGYDENQMIIDQQYLYGPVYAFDSEENASVQIWYNSIVCTTNGFDYLMGSSKVGGVIVWGNGNQSDDPPEDLLNCTPGMKATGSLCMWCPPGKYSGTYDQTFCKDCTPGKYAAARSSKCHECPLGKASGESSQELCAACQPGMFSNEVGATACAYCRLGTYSNIIEASACHRCDVGFTTENIASRNPDEECVCPRGWYLSKVDKTCFPCMRGLMCGEDWPNNWATHGLEPKLKENFYSEVSAPYETYMCKQAAGGCPGGVLEFCDGGRMGFMCRKCSKPGYHIVEGKCEKCPTYLRLFILITTLGTIAFIVGCYYLADAPVSVNAGHKEDFIVLIGIIVTILQMFGVLKSLEIQWPRTLKDFLERSSSVVTLDVQGISLSCAVGDSVLAQYVCQALFPFALIVVVGALGMTSRIIAGCCGKRWIAWSTTKCLNVLGQVLQALFIAICQMMVRPLQCYKHPNLKYSMDLFPEVICFEAGDHPKLILVAGGVFVFFIFPYIAWCVWACVQAPTKSAAQDIAFLQSVRFLLYRFRPDRWWWGLVVLMRQTALTFATVIAASTSGGTQLFLVGAVLLVYVYGAAIFWPWISTELSIVDSGTCLVLVLLLMCASPFLPVSALGGRVSLMVILFTALACVLVRYFVIFVMSICVNGFHDELCGATPDRLDLCQQWLEFIDTMQDQDKEQVIKTICQMNTFDRHRIVTSMHLWSAHGSRVTKTSRQSSAPRLCHLSSRARLTIADVPLGPETCLARERLQTLPSISILQDSTEAMTMRKMSLQASAPGCSSLPPVTPTWGAPELPFPGQSTFDHKSQTH